MLEFYKAVLKSPEYYWTKLKALKSLNFEIVMKSLEFYWKQINALKSLNFARQS